MTFCRNLEIIFVKMFQQILNLTWSIKSYKTIKKENKDTRMRMILSIPKKLMFSNFNVISTLHSSVKLVVYSCSHRHPLPKIFHKSTQNIVTELVNFLIVYNCGLYLG